MASKTENARRGGADIEIITRDQVIELNPVVVVHGLTVNPDLSSSLPSMSRIKNRSVVWKSWPLAREKSTWRNEAGMVIVLGVLSVLTIAQTPSHIKIQRGPRGETHLSVVHGKR